MAFGRAKSLPVSEGRAVAAPAEPAAAAALRLRDTVVDGGYCVGCGACASVESAPARIAMNEYGRYQAQIAGPTAGTPAGGLPVLNVCPFADGAANEDRIAEDLFGADCQRHPQVGFFRNTYVGHVAADDFRQRGTSGGLATWVACELLRRGEIDAVVHVRPSPDPGDSVVVKYAISRTVEEVRDGAKSRYYPVEMSHALNEVRNTPGRYLVVGVPCFIKAAQLLRREDPVFAERIRFTLSIFCGHLKSKAYGDMFAWQLGIHPDDLVSIDFRMKLPGRLANNYGVEVVGKVDGELVTRSGVAADMYGSDWGLGFFKYQACDYCDDVMGETADIAMGDAWLDEYKKDDRGTNVVIVRNALIGRLIAEGIADGRLGLGPISPDDVAKSQTASFRHRHSMLSYRLHLKNLARQWHPPKRIQPSDCRDDLRIQNGARTRAEVARESDIHWKAAVEANDFGLFVRRMNRCVERYRTQYLGRNRVIRGWRRAKGLIKRLVLSKRPPS